MLRTNKRWVTSHKFNSLQCTEALGDFDLQNRLFSRVLDLDENNL